MATSTQIEHLNSLFDLVLAIEMLTILDLVASPPKLSSLTHDPVINNQY